MGGRRHASFGCQHGQERSDFGDAHVARVPQAAPANEEANPIDIRLLGPQAVVAVARLLAHLVQQTEGRGG